MTLPTLDPERLGEWVGRTETSSNVLGPDRALQMAVTLGVDAPNEGDLLPPLWHWIHTFRPVAEAELGPEGHEKLGGFLPPVDLDRRMWAGSRVTFPEDVRIGDRLDRTSTVANVTVKEGRSGTLCFVTVIHELASDGVLSVSEEQDIVYRRSPEPSAGTPEPVEPPADSAWSDTVTPSEIMLFRYSAATFNSHRIHYDLDYCRDVEGYPGLVFHGPLTATLLADLAERSAGASLASFEFRGVAPLFHTAPFTIHGRPTEGGADLWAVGPDGGLAMTASAAFR